MLLPENLIQFRIVSKGGPAVEIKLRVTAKALAGEIEVYKAYFNLSGDGIHRLVIALQKAVNRISIELPKSDGTQKRFKEPEVIINNEDIPF
jgi:hypothetical protein